MAERFKQQQTHKSDSGSETNFPIVLDQVSRLNISNTVYSSSFDELIASLQCRRENLRARQVFDWEQTTRGNAVWTHVSGAV